MSYHINILNIRTKPLTLKALFFSFERVSDSLIYAAMMMGQSLAFVSTLTAAFVAGSRLFKVIDRQSKISNPKHVGERRKRDNESSVHYNKVNFRYPTRPQALILDDLDLEVLSGKTVALVGPSGCGKSTCVQLLQRLYDPDGGHIVCRTLNRARSVFLTPSFLCSDTTPTTFHTPCGFRT